MYNIYYYFFSLILLFFLYSKLNHSILFTDIIEHSKYPQLDGLRGVLALSVIFHHSFIMYNYFLTSKWIDSPSIFYTLIGQISVILFFFITGFLFGFKLLKSNFNMLSFYTNRIKRIIPLQVFSVVLSFLVILIIDNFLLKTSITTLSSTFIQWVFYGYFEQPLINNNSYSEVIETVYWTLIYEWKFYLTLPFLYFLKKYFLRKNTLFFLILFIIVLLTKNIFILSFLFGILSSYILHYQKNRNLYIVDISAILSLFYIFFNYDSAYHRTVVLLLFIVFYTIINGNMFQKFLKNKILMFFGTISYSIYLLHNIVVFIVFYILSTYIPINTLESNTYWAIVFLILNLTIVLSFFSYVAIERKFYQRSK